MTLLCKYDTAVTLSQRCRDQNWRFHSRFSSRFRSHIQKGLNTCVSGLWFMIRWFMREKNQRSEISCQSAFKEALNAGKNYWALCMYQTCVGLILNNSSSKQMHWWLPIATADALMTINVEHRLRWIAIADALMVMNVAHRLRWIAIADALMIMTVELNAALTSCCIDCNNSRSIFYITYGFCYVIFNSHMFNAPRFNSEKDVSLQFFFLL
jgi:hypothetical protein